MLESLRNIAASAIAEWEGSEPARVLDELTSDGDAECSFMDVWCRLSIESDEENAVEGPDAFFFASVLLNDLESEESKVHETINEVNKNIIIGHLVYADRNIAYSYRLLAEGVGHDQLNHVLSEFLQTAESAKIHIKKELGIGREVAPTNQNDTDNIHKIKIECPGLSGLFYIGDPGFLFQSDDEWKVFCSAVDFEQTQITYNGFQLALFNTHVDGNYLVYEWVDGEHRQLDAISIESAIIVVAPIELATADKKSLGDAGMILSFGDGLVCAYDLGDGGFNSIRIGNLYIPVDPDLQDALIDRDEDRAEEARQSQRKNEMAKALQKRNKKKKAPN